MNTTTVQKLSRETRVGISLRQKERHRGPVTIANIDEMGLFGASNNHLRMGQRVVAINGIPCPPLVAEAVQLIKDTLGTLTIVTADVEVEPEGTTVLATGSSSSVSLSLSLSNDDVGEITRFRPNHPPNEEQGS
jgi:C-terminal processing protease CtpA/Prc